MVCNDPCVLFALGREGQSFRRRLRRQESFSQAPCWATFFTHASQRVLVVETGIGPEKADVALDWLLRRPRLGNVAYVPKLIIGAGFAGALQDHLHVGDVVLATEVVDSHGTAWPTTWRESEPLRVPRHRGRILAVPHLVGDPSQKRTLGEKFQALAVDMESAALARRCHDERVPFVCIRAISDDVRTALSPRLVHLLGTGRVSPWRLLAALVRSPGLVRELWRLARATRVAHEQLANFLIELLGDRQSKEYQPEA